MTLPQLELDTFTAGLIYKLDGVECERGGHSPGKRGLKAQTSRDIKQQTAKCIYSKGIGEIRRKYKAAVGAIVMACCHYM